MNAPCIECNEIKKDKPRRGRCNACYKRFRKSDAFTYYVPKTKPRHKGPTQRSRYSLDEYVFMSGQGFSIDTIAKSMGIKPGSLARQIWRWKKWGWLND